MSELTARLCQGSLRLPQRGGVLLIGIEDDGQVLGIENDDFTTLSTRENADGYELFLRRLLETTACPLLPPPPYAFGSLGRRKDDLSGQCRSAPPGPPSPTGEGGRRRVGFPGARWQRDQTTPRRRPRQVSGGVLGVRRNRQRRVRFGNRMLSRAALGSSTPSLERSDRLELCPTVW